MMASAAQITSGLYKAWRAVGVPIGSAREIGRIGPTLAATGPRGLAGAVPEPDRIVDPAAFPAPVPIEGGWWFESVCAALHGPTIVDLLAARTDHTVTVGRVDHRPLLDAVVSTLGDLDHGLDITVVPSAGGGVLIRAVAVTTGAPALTAGPFEVARPVWERIEVVASRLLVPSSESSRRTGAGAGRIDND